MNKQDLNSILREIDRDTRTDILCAIVAACVTFIGIIFGLGAAGVL